MRSCFTSVRDTSKIMQTVYEELIELEKRSEVNSDVYDRLYLQSNNCNSTIWLRCGCSVM